MPSYTFTNKETGEQVSKFCSISERDAFLAENPEFSQDLCLPSVGDPMRLGVTKTSDGFQEILKNAKRYHKGNTINTRT